MEKRIKRRKTYSTGQIVFWVISLLVVLSMIVSVAVMFVPEPPSPTPATQILTPVGGGGQ